MKCVQTQLKVLYADAPGNEAGLLRLPLCCSLGHTKRNTSEFVAYRILYCVYRGLLNGNIVRRAGDKRKHFVVCRRSAVGGAARSLGVDARSCIGAAAKHRSRGEQW